MADLFPRIRGASRRPDPEERLADILELHVARPGITEATLGRCRTASGRTGYELLAGALPEDVATVVELGCGNGPLLDAILRLRPGVRRAIGIDLCEPELARARARLPRDRVELVRARMESTGLGTGCADAAVSHHALYLCDPIDAALAEVGRILRPGGLLASVTWTFDVGRARGFLPLLRVLGELTRRDVPHFAGWGDPRGFDRTTLEPLLAAAGFRGSLRVEEHDLDLRGTPDDIADVLAGFLYSAELLRDETRAELRAAWTRLLRSPGGEESHLRFPFALYTVLR